MDDGSGVKPVHYRRHFQDLPNRKQRDKKKDEEHEEEEEDQEEPRKGPPPPDGSLTIDLTA